MVRVLLEYGSDIAARNAVLWTPLDCSAANGWLRTAKILLDYHAPVDPEDKTGTTPLHLAAREGHVDVVQLLIERGANVNLLDKDSNNALDLAISNGHKYVGLSSKLCSNSISVLCERNLCRYIFIYVLD